MEVSGQLHALATLPQGKEPSPPRYLLDRRLDGPQSRSECGGVDKNSQPLSGLEPPITQPVTKILTFSLLNALHATRQVSEIKCHDLALSLYSNLISINSRGDVPPDSGNLFSITYLLVFLILLPWKCLSSRALFLIS